MNERNEKTKPLNEPNKMPILFLGHGSPMNAIDENEFVQGFRDIAKEIPKPKAILCVSAHWETSGTFLTAMEKPTTIHDFGGFPEELYAVEYPAPGSPALAKEIKKMFNNNKIELDETWGLDHGCWSVVKHLYPNADIPIVQMSLDYNKKSQYHYDLGKELFPLRQKDVLIIGSGNIVHNLRMVAWDKLNTEEYGFDWAIEADLKMKKYILNGDHLSLINYQSQGREFKLAVPTPEHFLPLLYILALKEENETVKLFNEKIVAGSLSMTSMKIG